MSRNNYAMRRFTARQVAFSTFVLNPPDPIANWTIASPRIFAIQNPLINPQSLFRVRNVMVSCNFADGLVWAPSNVPIGVYLWAQPYARGTNIGPLACTRGSEFVDVDTAMLVAGDVVVSQPLQPSDFSYGGGQYFQVDTIVGATQFAAPDFAWRTHLLADAVPAYKLIPLVEPLTSDEIRDNSSAVLVSSFNELYPVDDMLGPSSSTVSLGQFTPVTDVLLWVQIEMSGMQMYTESISTAFAGKTASIDVSVDIEYTQKLSPYN